MPFPPKDNPMHRITITEMSSEELDAHITRIRDRRLNPIRIYAEAQELRQRVIAGKLSARLDKQIHMLKKELDQHEKMLTKLDKRVLNIKALELELEDVVRTIDPEGTGGTERAVDGGTEVADGGASDQTPSDLGSVRTDGPSVLPDAPRDASE